MPTNRLTSPTARTILVVTLWISITFLIGLAAQRVFAEPSLTRVAPTADTVSAPLSSTLTQTDTAAMSTTTVTGRTIAAYGMQSDIYSVAWGDDDGNGDLDIAVGNWYLGTEAYRNTGSGFDQIAVGSASKDTFSVAWGDVDGDGDLDLAVGNDGGQNYVYRNTGSGFDQIAVGSASNRTFSVAWGDVDGDGDLDLAVGNESQPNYVYRNNGSGFDQIAVGSASNQTYSVAWGDYDGDGDLDLAVGNRVQPNYVYRNTGSGFDPTPIAVGSASSYTTSVAWGDVDGDGDLDLAVGNDYQPNYVYRNTGSGFDPTPIAVGSDSNDTTSVAWGDYDGDGDLDLAVGNWSAGTEVYRNTGSGFDPTPIAVVSASNDTTSMAWGDYDGDGDLDLAVGYSRVGTEVYRNTGSGFDLAPIAVFSSASNNTTSVAWGDYDGDGDLDLAVGNYGQNYVYRNEPAPPEIAIEGNGVTINSGDTTPNVVDDTGFGDALVGSEPVTHTFTISNTGTGPLSLSGSPTVALDDATHFRVTQPTSTSLAAGTSTTFQVVFAPTTTGSLTTTVSIANSDSDEQPYTFVVGGTGTTTRAPHIAVVGNRTVIQHQDTRPTADDHTYFGTTFVGGEPVTHTFTIRNTGTSDLVIGAPQLDDGVHFQVVTLPGTQNTTILPTEERTFQISFEPAVTGSLTDTVRIPTNDPAADPFVFVVGGESALHIEVTNTQLRHEGVMTVTITIVNQSEGAADGALLTIPVPSNLEDYAWICTASGGAVCPAPDPAEMRLASTGSGAINTTITMLPEGGSLTYVLTGRIANRFKPVESNGTLVPPSGVVLVGSPAFTVGEYLVALPLLSNEVNRFAVGSASSCTESVAWGDYDGDGDLDLAVGNFGQPNYVYRNTGSGFDQIAVGSASNNTLSVAWGDVDGDGDLDLAVGNGDLNYGPSTLGQPNYVYLNTGSGFDPTPIAVGRANNLTTSVAWVDYDGDGDLDLAVGNMYQPNYVYRNIGSGFDATPIAVGGPSNNTGTVAWGDYDGDGDLDLAVVNRSVGTEVYRNTGSGFDPTPIAVGSASNTTSMAWGDYDGDGDLDLAVGNWGQPNYVYRNTGSGFDPTPIAVFSSASNNTSSVAWGDYDGDGDLDLAVGNMYQPNYVYRNTGSGFDLAPIAVFSSASNTWDVAWGDYDGDGDLDLAVGNWGQNYVYRNEPAPPEIAIEGNSVTINSGDTTPNVADDTGFGDAFVGGDPVTHTFTISNTGTGPLSLSGSPTVALDDATHFRVTQPTSTSLAAGTSTTFQVVFAPTTTGSLTTTISIANSDSDENPYTFVVGGTGTVSEIGVIGNGVAIGDSDMILNIADDTGFGEAKGWVTWSPTPSLSAILRRPAWCSGTLSSMTAFTFRP